MPVIVAPAAPAAPIISTAANAIVRVERRRRLSPQCGRASFMALSLDAVAPAPWRGLGRSLLRNSRRRDVNTRTSATLSMSRQANLLLHSVLSTAHCVIAGFFGPLSGTANIATGVTPVPQGTLWGLLHAVTCIRA